MKIQSYKSIIQILLVLLAFFSIGFSNPKNPILEKPDEQEEKACWGLDLILLVDQSPSMISDNPNDPDGYRWLAAEDILNRLIINRREECTEAIHRLGIIAFSNEADTVLPLVKLNVQAEDNITVWADEYYNAINKAKTDTLDSGTDYFPAFEKAAEMLRNAEQIDDPNAYQRRRTVVVLLSDGNPTVRNQTSFVGRNLPNYMCDLTNYLTDITWQSVHMYFIALHAGNTYLNSTGCQEITVEQNWNNILNLHQGQLFNLEYNEQLIPASLNSIIDKEFGRPGKPIKCGEIFYVDPYLQEVSFSFYYRQQDANLDIRLSKLDETTLAPIYEVSSAGENVLNVNEVKPMKLDQVNSTSLRKQYVLQLPKPGKWRFSVDALSDDDCQRRIEASQVPLTTLVSEDDPGQNQIFPQFAEPPFFDEANPIYYQFSLITEKGDLIRQESDYPLTITANVTTPDGNKLDPFELVEVSEGVWKSVQQPVLTPLEGFYNVQFIGTALTGDKLEEREMFRKDIQYSAQFLNLIRFDITSPQKHASLPCNDVIDQKKVSKALKVSVRLTASGLNDSNINEAISTTDKNQILKASLRSSDGEVIEEIMLKDQDKGVYEGEFRASKNAPLQCGNLYVVVDFIGSYDITRFSMPVKKQSVEIKRYLAEGVRAEIISPLDKSQIQLHPTFTSACPGGDGTSPLRVDLVVKDLDGNMLNPAIITRPENTLYEVKLIPPQDADFKILAFKEYEEKADGFHLIYEDNSFDLTGDYRIEVRSIQEAFENGYVPAMLQSEPLSISVNRFDKFLVGTSTCKKIIISGWGLLGLVAIIALVASTGGAGGTLEFTTPGKENDVLAAARLSKARFKGKMKSKSLEGLDIGLIRYKKAKAYLSKRAVSVQVYDRNNDLTFSGDLELGEPMPGTTDYDIVYR